MDTIREQALTALEAWMAAMVAGQPPSDPYTVTWSIVTREDLAAAGDRKAYALGIYDTEETEKEEIGYAQCRLRVVIEWRQFLDTNQKASRELNRVLGDVKRRIREAMAMSPPLGVAGLFNLSITGSELSIDGMSDKTVGGAVFAVLSYRHAINDPRKLTPGS